MELIKELSHKLKNLHVKKKLERFVLSIKAYKPYRLEYQRFSCSFLFGKYVCRKCSPLK